MGAAGAPGRANTLLGSAGQAKRRRVLLVEDDRLLCDYLAGCLEAAGYEVSQAHNGLEGWCAYELEQPDLVVLDLDMPVISGFRLLRLLRPGPREGTTGNADDAGDVVAPAVVVMSGYDLQEAREAVIAGRPEAYLHKPFPERQLLSCVAHLLSRTERREWRRSA